MHFISGKPNPSAVKLPSAPLNAWKSGMMGHLEKYILNLISRCI